MQNQGYSHGIVKKYLTTKGYCPHFINHPKSKLLVKLFVSDLTDHHKDLHTGMSFLKRNDVIKIQFYWWNGGREQRALHS